MKKLNRNSYPTKQNEPPLIYTPISTRSSEEYITYHRTYLPFYLSQSFRHRTSFNHLLLTPLNTTEHPTLITTKRNSKMIDKNALKLNDGSDESFTCKGTPEELIFEKELDLEIAQLSSPISPTDQNHEGNENKPKKEIRIANFYQIPNKSIKLKPKDQFFIHSSNPISVIQNDENSKSINDETSKPFDDRIFWEEFKRRQKEKSKYQSLTNTIESTTIKCESPIDIQEKIKSPRLSVLHITQPITPDQIPIPSHQTDPSSTTESISNSTKSSLNPIPESPSPSLSPTSKSQPNFEKPKRNGIIVVGGLAMRTRTLIGFDKNELEKDPEGKLIRRASLPSPDSGLDEKSLKAKRKALCFRSH